MAKKTVQTKERATGRKRESVLELKRPQRAGTPHGGKPAKPASPSRRTTSVNWSAPEDVHQSTTTNTRKKSIPSGGYSGGQEFFQELPEHSGNVKHRSIQSAPATLQKTSRRREKAPATPPLVTKLYSVQLALEEQKIYEKMMKLRPASWSTNWKKLGELFDIFEKHPMVAYSYCGTTRPTFQGIVLVNGRVELITFVTYRMPRPYGEESFNSKNPYTFRIVHRVGRDIGKGDYRIQKMRLYAWYFPVYHYINLGEIPAQLKRDFKDKIRTDSYASITID